MDLFAMRIFHQTWAARGDRGLDLVVYSQILIFSISMQITSNYRWCSTTSSNFSNLSAYNVCQTKVRRTVVLKIWGGTRLVLYLVQSMVVCCSSVLACWSLFSTLLRRVLVQSSEVSLFCCCCELVRKSLSWGFGYIGFWVERAYSFPPFVTVKLFGYYYLVTDS